MRERVNPRASLSAQTAGLRNTWQAYPIRKPLVSRRTTTGCRAVASQRLCLGGRCGAFATEKTGTSLVWFPTSPNTCQGCFRRIEFLFSIGGMNGLGVRPWAEVVVKCFADTRVILPERVLRSASRPHPKQKRHDVSKCVKEFRVDDFASYAEGLRRTFRCHELA